MPKQLSGPVGIGGRNAPNDVAVVQYLLDCVPASRGGPAPELVIDGMCGPKTSVAIRNFQRANGCPQDGRVDPSGPTFRTLASYDPYPNQSLPPMGPPQGKGGYGPQGKTDPSGKTGFGPSGKQTGYDPSGKQSGYDPSGKQTGYDPFGKTGFGPGGKQNGYDPSGKSGFGGGNDPFGKSGFGPGGKSGFGPGGKSSW